jgi:uncharacterized protein (DUF849 family)
MTPTIITCAVTGAVTSREQTPYLPITAEEIADSCLEAAEAGAAIVHIHARNPVTGVQSTELEHYVNIVDLIKKENKDLLINLTTGPGAHYIPTLGNMTVGTNKSLMMDAATRVQHIQAIKPDLCSLDFNVMHHATDVVRINYKPVVKEMIKLIQEAGTKPELEIFDSGDLRIAQEFVADGTIQGIPFWQFATGIKYGWDSNINTLIYARNQLPTDAVWSAFGISRAEMPIVAHTAIMGGHVRVGMEDNVYKQKGILAQTNAELVNMAKNIIELTGGVVAGYADARKILGIQ